MRAWKAVIAALLSIGLVSCNTANPQPVCPPVYPTAQLSVTPDRVQAPAQVTLKTDVFGLCPDPSVSTSRYRVIVKSGDTTVADGIAAVTTGVSFTFEQTWNVVTGQAGVPAQGTVRLELRSVVQLNPTESITSPGVPFDVVVP